MATKSTQDAGALVGALQQVLGAKGADFSQKIEVSLLVLEESLNCLAGLGLISRLSVEVQAQTEAGKRYVRKFSLGTRHEEDAEGELQEVQYLKQFELEEDE